jgi:hypothetical protein
MIRTFADCEHRREHIGRFMNGTVPLEGGKLYDLSKCTLSWINRFGHVGCIYLREEGHCPMGFGT